MRRRCWIPLVFLVACSGDRRLTGEPETSESGTSASTTEPSTEGVDAVDEESSSTGETSGSETTDSETTDTDSETTDADSERTDAEASTGEDCLPMDYEVVEHDTLTREQCPRGNEEVVFQSKAEVEVWLAAACDDSMGCLSDCNPPPSVPWNKTTLLLAAATAPAGSESSFTWEIYDCGDHVQAHYTFHAWGPELIFYQRRQTIAVDKIDVPIDFYGESFWTREP